jgi:hypothetical protein
MWIAVALIVVMFFAVFLARPVIKPFHLGYVATVHRIVKDYGDVSVSFYSWEAAADNIKEMTDGLANGVYAIVSSPCELKLENVSLLFDEVEIDTRPGSRYSSVLKKKGVFMGEPEMKKFLELFERELALDLPAVA